MTVDDWGLVMSVSLRGAFLMSREVQPHIRAEGWGRIVSLSSTAALGTLGEANYAAAKAGIPGFTKSLAIDLSRHGITANAVAPGCIETAMTAEVAARVGISFEEIKDQAPPAPLWAELGNPTTLLTWCHFLLVNAADSLRAKCFIWRVRLAVEIGRKIL